ncbi:alpha/beta fold hydrolase [Pollutimonas bauzanensis]|uniref:Pimeloyl-ACP methyl ester carboxylesterase n=1 Tax=Pollutimonas bauzanensis TaxID=658167 RepID=A0A1M5WYZ7_9BURK|nr:alpha/beta hydrolase [Pollutimonas bauzanensis]SHH92528.1 Pimeloyl-ACP methyl ester carboxylesterase [Pollutimonas bauzanensis]
MSNTPLKTIALLLNGITIQLEIQWISPHRKNAPLIVFLHEGLGSLAMWGDWPARLCDATGCRGLVYSRYGYGHSTARAEGPWPNDYLEWEANEALPALLRALDIDASVDKPILFGHSDGGSIALLYAAGHPGALSAAVAVAPHVFTESMALERIAHMQANYGSSNLRKALLPFHRNPDLVFRGWSGRWLAPEFRAWNIAAGLADISCPLLLVQGRQDQYGTLDQIYEIIRRAPHAESLILENCRHIPHQEQAQPLSRGVADFLSRRPPGFSGKPPPRGPGGH